MRNARYSTHHPFHEMAAKPPSGPAFSPATLVFLSLAVLLLLAGALAFTWLQSASQKRARLAQELRTAMVQGTKQYENLRVDYESYTGGDYIRAAVSRFGLELHEPYYGQVYCIRRHGSPESRVTGPGKERAEETALVVQNW
ncbi:MAG: hypothetical protein GXP31_12580 [Kiritimatiellaeota bacterium]|nr:hypothetical protein [Kiritimatiellota bacterium]